MRTMDKIGQTIINLLIGLIIVIAAFTLYYFARNDKVFSRLEGALMMLMFLVYYTYVLLA